MNPRSDWRRWALLLLFPLFTAAAQAQSDEWPSRTIKSVSPFPPGGSTDLLARLFAPPLSRALGQPVIVENRAGAGGIVGAEAASRAAPRCSDDRRAEAPRWTRSWSLSRSQGGQCSRRTRGISKRSRSMRTTSAWKRCDSEARATPGALSANVAETPTPLEVY